MRKVLQINSEGRISLNGEPLNDNAFCKSFLETLYKKDHICRGLAGGEMVFVESSVAPLLVQDIEEVSKGVFKLLFLYGHEEVFELGDADDSGLYLDDWSRLCGENSREVPFVFTIAAQVKFLEKIVEPSGYDSFNYCGQAYTLNEWYIDNSETLKSSFWSERYQKSSTPWDLSTYHPCIDWTLPRLKLFKSKILVAGCGKGHDAAKLSVLGHKVLGIDFSAEAVKEAQRLYPKTEFREADVFKFADENPEQFDVVFEHTLFCAVSPSVREKLIKAWKKTLRPGGHLLGSFLVASKRKGPPFGITEWELEELLLPHFKIDYWGRLRGAETAREGKEIFVYAQKKK